MNYRKKPVVVQAMQLTINTVREVYEFVNGPITLGSTMLEEKWADYERIVLERGMTIRTLEDGADGRAKHVASVGDWVIRGVKGEYYPCKPDIFAVTYEAVTP